MTVVAHAASVGMGHGGVSAPKNALRLGQGESARGRECPGRECPRTMNALRLGQRMAQTPQNLDPGNLRRTLTSVDPGSMRVQLQRRVQWARKRMAALAHGRSDKQEVKAQVEVQPGPMVDTQQQKPCVRALTPSRGKEYATAAGRLREAAACVTDGCAFERAQCQGLMQEQFGSTVLRYEIQISTASQTAVAEMFRACVSELQRSIAWGETGGFIELQFWCHCGGTVRHGDV